MHFLYRNKEIHISKEAMTWVLSEFHQLLGEVHSAAARSYSQVMTNEVEDENETLSALIPRRFHREVELQSRQPSYNSNQSLSVPAHISALPSFDHINQHTSHRGTVTTKSGQLHASFEGTHWSKEWPLGNNDSGFVQISFLPTPNLKLPGIGIAFFKQPEDLGGSCHSFLTTFNVLSSEAPILQAIKDGDRGVSKVLRMLKSGEHWAGDRDEDGLSLLSVCVGFVPCNNLSLQSSSMLSKVEAGTWLPCYFGWVPTHRILTNSSTCNPPLCNTSALDDGSRVTRYPESAPPFALVNIYPNLPTFSTSYCRLIMKPSKALRLRSLSIPNYIPLRSAADINQHT